MLVGAESSCYSIKALTPCASSSPHIQNWSHITPYDKANINRSIDQLGGFTLKFDIAYVLQRVIKWFLVAHLVPNNLPLIYGLLSEEVLSVDIIEILRAPPW